MRQWEIAAVLLVVVGTVGIALPTFGVVSVSDGATYYVEAEAVDQEAVPDDSDVRPIESLANSTADAVSRSADQTGSSVELPSRPVDLVPEYVRDGNATYRVSVWHTDQGLNFPGYLVGVGGWILAALGGVGVFAALGRRAVHGN
ncbi:hypothetical protein [Halosimplex sp. J119]